MESREVANKPLPYSHSGECFFNVESSDLPEPEREVVTASEARTIGKNYSSNQTRGNYQYDSKDYLEEGRSKKQPSVSESTHLEILDDAFLQSIESGVNQIMSFRDRPVDLKLIRCAEAAGRGDQETASAKLKQIMQHSSPFGDASQSLAHYFANGLEVRLAGHGRMLLSGPITQNSTTAADILKAYQPLCYDYVLSGR
ncbi:hypothetical protein NC653_022652 [Populus alba x Populus x berolinensis]|uniref:Uncharacterized protein n=1 Tax=Populus alba x Populus x berolinensis TaxID=444605 RepID=A0AAD6MFL6_9ROSI|nr:hypothetical protein NC653_022652 [Populus alba x Populus x berolinensis]